MGGIRHWFIDIWSFVVSGWCWFTPNRCHDISTRVALIIGILTLVFVTLPKVVEQTKKLFTRLKHDKK